MLGGCHHMHASITFWGESQRKEREDEERKDHYMSC